METVTIPERKRGRPRKTVQEMENGRREDSVHAHRTTTVWSDEDRLLTVDEVADLLRMRPKTLRYYKSQYPERVPPWIRLPGMRPPLWRLKDVRAFIDQGVSEGEKERLKLEEMRQEGFYPFPKKKRGRPTKRKSAGREGNGC